MKIHFIKLQMEKKIICKKKERFTGKIPNLEIDYFCLYVYSPLNMKIDTLQSRQ